MPTSSLSSRASSWSWACRSASHVSILDTAERATFSAATETLVVSASLSDRVTSTASSTIPGTEAARNAARRRVKMLPLKVLQPVRSVPAGAAAAGPLSGAACSDTPGS